MHALRSCQVIRRKFTEKEKEGNPGHLLIGILDEIISPRKSIYTVTYIDRLPVLYTNKSIGYCGVDDRQF